VLATPAASNSSPRSIAQRCHSDALHCIFAFLALKELLPALLSCRDWYAAGCKEPSRALVLRPTPDFIPLLVASPLRHHVAELVLYKWHGKLRVKQLRLLRALPRLTALEAFLDAADVDAQMPSAQQAESLQQQTQFWRDTLPPQLRSLHLVLLSPVAPSILQSLLHALPSLPALRALHLDNSSADLDLSPLLQLAQLQELHLQDSPSPSQCATIKQLATLTTLEVPRGWRSETLLELLRPPHALQQLQRVPRIRNIGPALMAALRQLSELTELQPGLMAPDCWAGLGAFPQLRTLRLHWPDGFTSAQQSALEASLNAFPNLSDLSLYRPWPQWDTTRLALRLPALRGLRVDNLGLPSLDFLQHSPLLERLALNCCQIDAVDFLRCVQSCYTPQLRHLQLWYSVILSDAQLAQLHPPSAQLPALRQFVHHFDELDDSD